jgi:hypothetical protein
VANVIDVDFVQVCPAKGGEEILREVNAEVDKTHWESMRATAITAAVPVILTAGLLLASFG